MQCDRDLTYMSGHDEQFYFPNLNMEKNLIDPTFLLDLVKIVSSLVIIKKHDIKTQYTI